MKLEVNVEAVLGEPSQAEVFKFLDEHPIPPQCFSVEFRVQSLIALFRLSKKDASRHLIEWMKIRTMEKLTATMAKNASKLK